MSCAEWRERIQEKVTGTLVPEDRQALEDHLRDCSDCRAYLEELQEDHRLLAAYGDAMKKRVAQAERRIVEMAGTSVSATQAVGAERAFFVPREFFRSRWTRYAAAALIVFGIVIVSQLWRSPQIVPVAWAQVIAQVGQAEDVICRWRLEITSPRRMAVDGVHYRSRTYGARDDQYKDGEMYMQTYYSPQDLVQISVDPERQEYYRIRMNQDEFEYRLMEADAQEMVALFKDHPYEDLGRRKIDGVQAEGIELTDPEFMMGVVDSSRIRLWVDTATGWPIRLVTEMTADEGRFRQEMVYSDFQWNAAVTPDQVQADIPADYELTMDLDAPVPDEQRALEGLRLQAELLNGRYPSSLTWGSAVNPLIMNPGALVRHGTDRFAGVNDLMRIRDTIAFYVELQKDDLDVVYHGDEVTSADSGGVLLRWRTGGDYRVVFGDLRTENISSERLSRLEGAL